MFILYYGSAAKSHFTGNLIDRMTDMTGIIISNFWWYRHYAVQSYYGGDDNFTDLS